MLAFQKFLIASTSPPRKRRKRSASHARIHAFSRESPRSHGMSRVRPAANGQVNARATPRYSKATLAGLRADGLGLLVFSGKSSDQVPDFVQLLRRCERDHAEVSVTRIHAEPRAV